MDYSLTKKLKEMLEVRGDILGKVKVGEKCIESLLKSEKKLVQLHNTVLKNMHLLPGFVLGVSTGVSGMFFYDVKVCELFIPVVLIGIIFCIVLGVSLRYAHIQLSRLKPQGEELAVERNNLYGMFALLKQEIENDANPVMKKLSEIETQNKDLQFVMLWYNKYLWVIGTCGVLYVMMFLIAGFYVFCGHIWAKSSPTLVPFQGILDLGNQQF